VGGGGALGSVILEQLLGRGRFARVRVLVTQDFSGSVHALDTVMLPSLEDGDGGSPADALAEVAVVVFDRERPSNGREAALFRPQPGQLPALARWLWRRGVRHVVVVMPHSPAGLPESLKLGLASLDEQAVTALGFEHVVFVRTAQQPAALRGRSWPQRVADGLLLQLQLMIPAMHKPVRVRKVAAFVTELAAQLPAAAHGARVAPPELVWQAAQHDDAQALVAAWLAGVEGPPLQVPRTRW